MLTPVEQQLLTDLHAAVQRAATHQTNELYALKDSERALQQSLTAMRDILMILERLLDPHRQTIGTSP